MSLSMHGVRCFTKQQLKKEETQLVQKSKNETLMCMKMQISLNTSTILLQTIWIYENRIGTNFQRTAFTLWFWIIKQLYFRSEAKMSNF